MSVLAHPVAAAPAVSPANTREVTPADQVEFDQTKALANLRELEDRMFRLAEVTRQLEPEDSARLLLAVRRAREELIAERMHEVRDLIQKRELDTAAERQKLVIEKLQELRELLTATDLELRLNLERLRGLRAAIKQIEVVIADEKRHERMAEGALEEQQKTGKPIDPRNADAFKNDQQRTRKTNESIEASVKELGGNTGGAQQSLAQATGGMKNAEGALGQGKPGDAAPQQRDAIRNLEQAKNDLQKEEERVKEELKRQVAREVTDRLQVMLEKQQKIRESSEALSPKSIAGEREAMLAVQRLSPSEEKLSEFASETAALVEETEFSAALPPALRSIERRMLIVTADLKTGKAGEKTIDTEKAIEADIQELLEAMKPASQAADPKQGQQGNCKSCGNNKNKLLSELRIVRILQARVNEETIEVDRRAATDGLSGLSPEQRKKVEGVRDRQSQVAETMEKIHKTNCPDCAR